MWSRRAIVQPVISFDYVNETMPTPAESADLLLKLYELRREPVLREARAWFLADFNPTTFAEIVEVAGGERNASFRMVLGYWDMAASFVTFGAIDAEMFRAANPELVTTFAKVRPFLDELRVLSTAPDFCRHIQSVMLAIPGAEELLALRRAQLRTAAEQRALKHSTIELER